MARALILAGVVGVSTASFVPAADAQEAAACDAAWLDAAALRRAVALELSSIERERRAGLRVAIDACTDVSVTFSVRRGETVLERREVAIDDVDADARIRTLAYLIGEAVRVASAPDAERLRTLGPAEARSTSGSEVRSRQHPARASRPPSARDGSADDYPLEASVDTGLRWFPRGGGRLATTRATFAADALVFDVRHSFGPNFGDPPPLGLGGTPFDGAAFHVGSLGMGFRHRIAIGEHRLRFDTVGYGGALWTPPHDGYPDSYGGRARYGVAGLEARLGIDLAFGVLRVGLTLECGYAQARRPRVEDPTAPLPVRPVSGPYLGATVAIGWSRAPR